MTTVLLLAHPTFETSRANRVLLSAVAGTLDIEVADLYALYADGRINASAERDRLLRATRLVMQFPLHWYSTPALLKEWQDVVLTPLFYVEPNVAAATAGLPLLIATTTGGPLASYRPGGTAMPIDELLAPLRAVARRCRWSWQLPFAVHDVRNLDDAALVEAGDDYRAAVSALPPLTRTPGLPAVRESRASNSAASLATPSAR